MNVSCKNKNICKYLIISVFSCFIHVAISQTRLQRLVDSLENSVKSLATSAAPILSKPNLCSNLIRNCQGECDHDSCSTISIREISNANASCSLDFGNPPECSTSGQELSTDKSTIRVAEQTDLSSSPTDNLRNAMKDICATRTLDMQYQKNYDTFNDIAWQYVGTTHGIYRVYPGHTWLIGSDGGCSPYDPRIRPWYIAATTGAKRVILVLDSSGSMAAGYPYSRWDITLQAAFRVLDTLSNADYFGIVTFSDSAQAYKQNLQRASAESIRMAKEYLTRVGVAGQTYYNVGFDEAFNMIDRAVSQETGSSACRTVILFLTDGAPTGMTGDDALALIRNRNTNNAFIVSYVLGEDNDNSLYYVRKFSCENRGIYSQIIRPNDLIDAMGNYYQFLSVGIQRDTVVWSEPYEDALGIGTVTTASVPIYDQTVIPPVLVGVAGVDVRMSIFEDFGGSRSDDLLNLLISKSQTCNDFKLSDCEFEKLRGEKKCNYTLANTCPADEDSHMCALKEETSPWCFSAPNYYTSSEYKNSICCDDGLSVGIIVAIAVGSTVGGSLIGVTTAILVRRYRRKKCCDDTNTTHTTNSTQVNGMNPMPLQYGQPVYTSTFAIPKSYQSETIASTPPPSYG